MEIQSSQSPFLPRQPVRSIFPVAVTTLLTGLVVFWQSSLVFAIDVSAYAEPSQPVKTYSYTSTATGAQSWVMNATVVESPSSPETVNGQLYRIRIQETRGIDGYDPEDRRTFYSERKEGLYSGYYDAGGHFTEYLLLPANIGIGDSWQDPSGFWDNASLDQKSSYQSQAGSFSDCLHISQERSMAGPPVQQMTSTSIHCPDVGMVYSRVEHGFEGFQSITEMELVNIE